nr:FixG Ig-like domain-containing protein [Piscinibacter sp.]
MLRTPFRVDVVRDRGALARLVDDGQIENVYRLQMMNATEGAAALPHQVRAWRAIQGKPPVEVGPAEARWVPVAARCRRSGRRAGGRCTPFERSPPAG